MNTIEEVAKVLVKHHINFVNRRTFIEFLIAPDGYYEYALEYTGKDARVGRWNRTNNDWSFFSHTDSTNKILEFVEELVEGAWFNRQTVGD